MVYLSHLPSWLCGAIIVSSFVVLSIIGLALFQWLIVGRLRLTEEMNNDIIFFASAIALFYSLTFGLIAVGVWTSGPLAIDSDPYQLVLDRLIDLK